MSAQAGVWCADGRSAEEELLSRLLAANRIQAPHRQGTYREPGLVLISCGVNFDTLAATERQPAKARDGSLLTWDGRLDNRQDLRMQFRECGGPETTDAELVAEAAARWGADAPTKILGDWSFVRWDPRERELSMASDYAGNRPLYVFIQRGMAVWSSSLEALAAACQLRSRVSDDYIGARLTFGDPGLQTFYAGILRVPAGHVLTIAADQRYRTRAVTWLRRASIAYADANQYEEEYRALLTEAVKVRLRASGTVWTELSGGHDSSSLTCTAAQLVRTREVEAQAVQPVSVVSPQWQDAEEDEYIAAVERWCGVQSVRVPFEGEYQLGSAPGGPGSEGGAGGGARSTDDEARRAGATVLISGEFGDCITTGGAIQDVLRDHLLSGRLRACCRASLQHSRATGAPITHAWYRLAVSLLQRSHAKATRGNGVAGASGRGRRTGKAAMSALRREFIERCGLCEPDGGAKNPELAPEQADSLVARRFRAFVGDDLFNGVRGPLRVTYPFTHKPLVEFVLAVPASILWRVEHPRGFACAALRDILPEAIVMRRSKGYASPAVCRYVIPTVQATLPSISNWQLVTRGYAEPDALKRLMQAFTSGSQESELFVLRLLEVERLLRTVAS